MYGILHAVGTIVLVPYLLLAGGFLLIGKVAASQGLWAALDAVLEEADWLVRWGIYALPVLIFALALAGFVPRLRGIGLLSLVLLSGGSLLAICLLHSTRVGLGELVFLAPCVLVFAASGLLLARRIRSRAG
jgi:hypothetical protein